jgi:putative hydrolase of the HAD superfamily
MAAIIDWAKVDTVFLDMDGTLLDLAFDNYFWHEYVPLKYAQAKDLEFAAAKHLLKQKYNNRQGTLSWYCTDYWTETLELNIATLKEEVAHRVKLFPKVKEFLQWLREQHKQVILLTNAHQDSIDVKFSQTGLQPFFHRVITSHQLGYAKEQRQFWPLLAGHHQHDPATSLLIDDNVYVLRAAQQYGIEYLLSVKQPDSNLPQQDTAGFLGLNSFEDIVTGI